MLALVVSVAVVFVSFGSTNDLDSATSETEFDGGFDRPTEPEETEPETQAPTEAEIKTPETEAQTEAEPTEPEKTIEETTAAETTTSKITEEYPGRDWDDYDEDIYDYQPKTVEETVGIVTEEVYETVPEETTVIETIPEIPHESIPRTGGDDMVEGMIGLLKVIVPLGVCIGVFFVILVNRRK